MRPTRTLRFFGSTVFAGLLVLVFLGLVPSWAFATPQHNIWPDSTITQEQEYIHYRGLADMLGHPVGDRPTLLGIRGLTLWAEAPHEVRSTNLAYDDTFILLVPDTNTAYAFPGATHPFRRISDEAPDVDDDGRGDVAMIRPGLYTAERMDPERLLVRNLDGTGRIPAYRDFNHNGRFEPEEKARSFQITEGRHAAPNMGLFATAILFHVGGGFGSIGCQTAAAHHIALLHAHAPFDYLLVDAVDALSVASTLPDTGQPETAPLWAAPGLKPHRVERSTNVRPGQGHTVAWDLH
ncbi:MAG: hypothetical protein AAFX99_21850 [Myxococcota bacterium]